MKASMTLPTYDCPHCKRTLTLQSVVLKVSQRYIGTGEYLPVVEKVALRCRYCAGQTELEYEED